jgi:hypothetical protein
MTDTRSDDPWVHPKACDRRHEELAKQQTMRDAAIFTKLEMIEKSQTSLGDRIYKDNGHMSIQSKQNQHDELIRQILAEQKCLNAILSRLTWLVIALLLSGIATGIGLVLKHVFLGG